MATMLVVSSTKRARENPCTIVGVSILLTECSAERVALTITPSNQGKSSGDGDMR